MDIKTHPWFRAIDWQAIHNRKVAPPYVPKIKGMADTSNFDKYDVPLNIEQVVTDYYSEYFADF